MKRKYFSALLTALIHNFYKTIISKLDTKAFGLKETSRIKAFVFIQNIGRQLFYTIASSYITLYLAIVFLVVANTIVGVQFLMSQQKTGRRLPNMAVQSAWVPHTICVLTRASSVWNTAAYILTRASLASSV